MAASKIKTWANAKSSGMAGTADNGSGGKQGGVRSPKQKEKAGKQQPHIVEEHLPSGKVKVHEFGSKSDAHKFGMGLRREGKTAYAFEKDSKFSTSAQHPDKVEKAGGGGGDDQKRDDQGRFA